MKKQAYFISLDVCYNPKYSFSRNNGVLWPNPPSWLSSFWFSAYNLLYICCILDMYYNRNRRYWFRWIINSWRLLLRYISTRSSCDLYSNVCTISSGHDHNLCRPTLSGSVVLLYFLDMWQSRWWHAARTMDAYIRKSLACDNILQLKLTSIYKNFIIRLLHITWSQKRTKSL